jgi:ectoine hydroxylase-related dioxygenase (phytanoyl-CoA dioxygenase family)
LILSTALPALDALKVNFSTHETSAQANALTQAKQVYDEYGCFIAQDLVSASELSKIQENIQRIVNLYRAQIGLSEEADNDGVTRFDDGFMPMNRADRQHGGVIYRVIRRVTPIHELAVQSNILAISQKLMNSDLLISNGSMAVRVDQPNEDKYLFDWHQDYPYIQDSPDGIVIWMALHDVDENGGCLRVIPSSHKLGLLPVRVTDPTNARGNRAASISIADKSAFEQLPTLQVPMKAGDALVFSTLLLHASSANRSTRARWTIQFRYGNFANDLSVKKKWPGALYDGQNFWETHPEYVVNVDEVTS